MFPVSNPVLKKIVRLVGHQVNNMPGTAGLVVGGVVGIGAATIGVPVALTVAGFGATGVAAGSVAAAVQSSIGSVAAGSTFAVLQMQSAGAAGISWVTTGAIAGTGAVIGWVAG